MNLSPSGNIHSLSLCGSINKKKLQQAFTYFARHVCARLINTEFRRIIHFFVSKSTKSSWPVCGLIIAQFQDFFVIRFMYFLQPRNTASPCNHDSTWPWAVDSLHRPEPLSDLVISMQYFCRANIRYRTWDTHSCSTRQDFPKNTNHVKPFQSITSNLVFFIATNKKAQFWLEKINEQRSAKYLWYSVDFWGTTK